MSLLHTSLNLFTSAGRPLVRWLNKLPDRTVAETLPPGDQDGLVQLNDGSRPYLVSHGPADRLPPLVSPVDEEPLESTPFYRDILPLVERKVFPAFLAALWDTLRLRAVEVIEDDRLHGLARDSFADIVEPDEAEGVWKIDLAYHRDEVNYAPGLYHAGTVLRFTEERIESITMLPPGAEPYSVKPGDPLFPTCKIWFCQAMVTTLIFGFHAAFHAQQEMLIHATRRLPDAHPLRRLLWPHVRYNLTTNRLLVQEAIPQYSLFATASAVDDSSLVQMYRLHYPKVGHAGASLCPAYFEKSPKHAVIQGYERAIRAWITAFAGETEASLHDADAVEWMRTIHRHVPEFPLSPESSGREAWIDAITALLTRITVVHSTQHHALSQWENIVERPLRMRRPPPSHAGDVPDFPVEAYQWKVDQFQAALFQRAVVEPVNAPPLQDIRYEFVDRPALDAAAERFRSELRELGRRFPTLMGAAPPLMVYQGIFV